MKKRYIYFIVAFFITSCDILGGSDKKEPCPPTVGPGCDHVNSISIDTDAAWSPDGNTIAFFSSGNNGEDFGIYFINADGSDRRLFHSGLAEAPAWSPDGQWVAFHQDAHIFKKHVETDSLVQLTFEGRNFHPVWSPDSEWIVYNMSICNGPNTCGIWLMSSDGTQKRNLSNFGNYPDWHPTDSKLIFRRGRSEDGYTIGNEIWEYDINTQRERLLSFLERENHFSTRHLRYSPSGSKIVFQSQPGPDSSVPPPWLRQIWVMNSDGSALKQLTDTGGLMPAWSPDGEWIIYTETYETGRLWLMRPDGSDKHQLTFD